MLHRPLAGRALPYIRMYMHTCTLSHIQSLSRATLKLGDGWIRWQSAHVLAQEEAIAHVCVVHALAKVGFYRFAISMLKIK
ncbi:hypothetical protein LI328DRAFT_162810 [Trichoderma asperelloides]|nr:hypothetical protein LI328DRAFT_162810 [Trichoderma asperelloides]